MKSILVSKPPKIVANVLNDLASILIFKTCPKDWKDYLSGKTKEMPKPTDVYIYCTKETNYKNEFYLNFIKANQKVVAKFTLNKVEEISKSVFDEEPSWRYYENEECLEEQACLNNGELQSYLKMKNGYAWHISNLVIFDEPKELGMFSKSFIYWNKENKEYNKKLDVLMTDEQLFNTNKQFFKMKAPKSWCYVEVEK